MTWRSIIEIIRKISPNIKNTTVGALDDIDIPVINNCGISLNLLKLSQKEITRLLVERHFTLSNVQQKVITKYAITILPNKVLIHTAGFLHSYLADNPYQNLVQSAC